MLRSAVVYVAPEFLKGFLTQTPLAEVRKEKEIKSPQHKSIRPAWKRAKNKRKYSQEVKKMGRGCSRGSERSVKVF